MPVSLKDKVALVVGASSGIGRACAVMLAKEGAKVMAAARREARLRDLEKELPGSIIKICAADARKAPEMQRLADETKRLLGTVQILIYATGTNTPDRAMRRLRPEIWDELVETNLSGAYYITHAVLPAMREARDGHLIYISSISGHTPDVSGAAYQASKRGLIGLAHAVRVEERENQIRTTVVNPGLVDTEILAKRPVKTPDEVVAQALLPEHVAEIVLSCAKLPPKAVVTELSVVPTTL
ncbi:MAG TPA: SDR family NAD(P)-dependent oxidoreductase [Bryobacteraceae bacterium]|nr:SDR family NAD(P)-dependent oxidoreductase [Bryobacteraceae bacterium]